MFEKLRKKLDLNWVRKNGVWDVVVYGSYARGKDDARDIDVAMILTAPAPAARKMQLCQELRRKLASEGYALDVKAADLNDFLNAGFLGREAIFAEGRSLVKRDYVAERFGFAAIAIVEYSLKPLTPSRQKMLYYALQGRKRGTGLLAKLGGSIISKGVLQVPTRHYEEIRELLDREGISYTTTFALRYRILR